MNSQKTLLLDLDGVLVDMIVPLMQWWGVHITNESQYPQQFGWDVRGAIVHCLEIQDRAEAAADIRAKTTKEFWHSPPYIFWRELQPYPTAPDFVRFLETGPFDIYLMTAHANGFCATAKVNWIDEHFPKYWDRVLVGHPKHLAANSHSILIDDSPANCEDFTAAGGTAIMCPRPWNERWNALECFHHHDGRRRPEHNVVARDLHEIMEHVDTP